MKRRYLLLEFLQDNEGKVYAFMYDQEKGICLNFKFWEWIEILPNIRAIVFDDHNEDCESCPYYNPEEEDDDS